MAAPQGGTPMFQQPGDVKSNGAPYQSNFDTGPIRELAAAFTNLADLYRQETAAMGAAVTGISWTGDANHMALSAWDLIQSQMLGPAAAAADTIASNLNTYADNVDAYIHKATAGALAQEIAGIFGFLLDLAGLALGALLGPALDGLLTWLDGIAEALSAGLASTLRAIGGAIDPIINSAAFSFISDVVLGAGLSVGQDALSTLIGDKAEKLPFSLPKKQIGIDAGVGAGVGAVFGGLGAAGKIFGKKPDPGAGGGGEGDPLLGDVAPAAVTDPAPPAVSAADGIGGVSVAGLRLPDVSVSPGGLRTGLGDNALLVPKL